MSNNTGRKHYNLGNVYGTVREVKEETSRKKTHYLSMKVDVSGKLTGNATAFCRIWGEQRCREFMDDFKRGLGQLHLTGNASSYKSEKNEFYLNYTVHKWQEEAGDNRAVFVLRGEVLHPPQPFAGGQRIILTVRQLRKEGEEPALDEFELYTNPVALLDKVSLNDFVEVKGILRQEEPNDIYGGGDGPVRAYVEKLKVLS